MRDTGPRGKQCYFFHWSIIALQCSATFCCKTKWINHTYTCIFSLPKREGRSGALEECWYTVTLVGPPSLPVKGWTVGPKGFIWGPKSQNLRMWLPLEIGLLQMWLVMKSCWSKLGSWSNRTSVLIGRWCDDPGEKATEWWRQAGVMELKPRNTKDCCPTGS